MTEFIKILLIEDNDGDARIFERSFSKIKTFQSDILRVIRLEEAVSILESNEFDVILLDLSLPDADGIQIIDKIKNVNSYTPIVVLTGLNDEALAMESVNKGAHEFLVKGEISSSFLPIVIRYAIESARNNALLQKAKVDLEEKVQKRTDELKLAHARALRSEKLAAIGAMVAGLAHESRNSLQRIQASVNRLNRRSKDNGELIEISSDIELAVDDLNHLYNTVREYSLPLKLNKQNDCIVSIFENTLKKIKSSKNHILPEVAFNVKSFNTKTEVDAKAFEQVFRNFLENSIQAIHPKKALILFKVTRIKQEELNYTEIIVADNGPGIPKELQADLFEPFFTTKNTGTGLGMAISKRIVQEHNGLIEILNSSLKNKNLVYDGLVLSIKLPFLD